MTRQHPPCSTCARFVKSAPGHCTGFDRPAEADDAPCVLFLERGSREARRDSRNETISRASQPLKRTTAVT